MADSCYHVTEHTDQDLWTSDIVLYNGIAIPCITVPDQPTLNEVLQGIGTLICSLTPVAGYGSDDITVEIAMGCPKTDIGDSLSDVLSDISTYLCNLTSSISGFVSETDFNANTILKADTDDTPVALTVAEQRVVGRVTGDVIDDLTGTQVLNILEAVLTTADVTKPYTAKYFGAGANTTADKMIFVPLEDATFANNPYLAWLHDILGRGYEALAAVSKNAVPQMVLSMAAKEDAALLAHSFGVGADVKDQTLYLADQTAAIGTLRYWYLRKDGADSRNLKLGYFNGAAETEILEIDTATLKFNLNSTTAITGVLDEDTMVSDSAVHVPTQQSVKAYFDNNAATQTELDDTQTGAGLNNDGSYTPDAASTYLTASTSLYDADSILDGEIAEINARSDETVEQTKKNVLCAMEVVDFSDIATAGTYTVSATAFPTGSVITNARIQVTTAFEDDDVDTSTIGVYIVAAGDIKAAAAIGTDYTAGVISNANMDYDYSFATPIETTLGDKIMIVVAMGGLATTLDAGSMRIYVEYF